MDIARILSVRSEKVKKCELNFSLPVANPAYSRSLPVNFHSFPRLTQQVDKTPSSFMKDVDNKVKNYVNLNMFSFSLFPRVCALEDPDVIQERKEKELKRIKEFLSKEDKWDRLKRMYSIDDFGRLSPEMHYVLTGAYFSAGVAGIFGAIRSMNKGREDFFRANVETPYESDHLARRSLTDRLSMCGVKGFFKNALKFGSFSSFYMLGTFTAANYNNKVTVWEHMACAAIIGSISRMNFGIKGMAVASVLGGILGLFSGCLVKTSMWMSGISIEELRYWQHGYYMGEFSEKLPKISD